MAPYRIMIVDDEAEIRNGIKRKIDWLGNGFELVASAENGQEALEMAEMFHPDVVMTDIKMPFMDGLTLGKCLSERMPSTKLVIFSGFDDFEYAQKAIQLNVEEYLLKPIDAAELTSVLQRVKGRLDAEFMEKRSIQQLRAHYESSLPILREQFLSQLIQGRVSKNKIDELSARYDLDLRGSLWVACFLYFDAGNDCEAPTIGQSELIPLSIKQLTDESLPRRCRFKSFIYNDQVAVIAMLDEREQLMSLIDGMNQICRMACRYLGLNVTAGVGSICDSPTLLRFSASGARMALDYRVLIGTGRAIYIKDVEPDPNAQLQYDEQDEHDLISAIKLGTSENIQTVVERIIGRFRAARLPFAQYQLYLMETMAELLRVLRAYQIDPAEVFGKEFDGNFHLSNFDSLDALSVWFIDVCQNISSLIRRERMNSTKALANNAGAFIRENFNNPDISVEMLCDHLHVSPAYFSTLFKKETGMSFVAYLTEVRMEEAIRLLSTTEDKTYEISTKVGYTEPNYFSYVFKKQFGMSPTKYRANTGDENV